MTTPEPTTAGRGAGNEASTNPWEVPRAGQGTEVRRNGHSGPSGSGGGPSGGRPGPLASLARIRQQPVASGDPGERCEMCAEGISSEHTHLVDLHDRSLVCTCQACYLLFEAKGAAGGRYRAVPRGYRTVIDFELSPMQWDSLQIPVAVAFFFRNSSSGDVGAFFPSPAGATECLLPLETWDEVEEANPILASLEPDVEAVLVRNYREQESSGVECFIVPIDSCYELVGHLRTLWRGFDGGQDVHNAMAAYFARLRVQGRPVERGDSGG